MLYALFEHTQIKIFIFLIIFFLGPISEIEPEPPFTSKHLDENPLAYLKFAINPADK